MCNLSIFASGSGSNAENIVNYFACSKNIVIKSVFSNNPNAFVLERANKLGIPSFTANRKDFFNSEIVLDELKKQEIDWIILAGFLWLVPEYLIKAFPNKIINIHPALLPKYGGKGMYGMNVHNAVIENGDKESGITIHYVNNEYDKGQIIHQSKCTITSEDTPESLAQKVHKLEYENFPKVIESIIKQS